MQNVDFFLPKSQSCFKQRRTVTLTGFLNICRFIDFIIVVPQHKVGGIKIPLTGKFPFFYCLCSFC
jgi:hypothetical protein